METKGLRNRRSNLLEWSKMHRF